MRRVVLSRSVPAFGALAGSRSSLRNQPDHRMRNLPPIVAALAATLFSCAAFGATLNVTNNAESGAGSLRQAIADAHAGDEIQFAAALNSQTIALTSGQLAVAKNLTITGPAADKL